MKFMLIPTVIERNNEKEYAYDIYSRLLKDRIILLNGEIDDNTSNIIVAQLLYLDSLNNDDISIYINSPGGSITSGMAIYDTMQFMRCDIVTYCIGQVASMGTILLAAGTKGKRYALPNSRIMIHQPTGGASGQASDISIAAKEILRWRKVLNEILSKHSGHPLEQIEKDSDRDYFMTAEEAKEYGIVDCVIENKKDIPQSN